MAFKLGDRVREVSTTTGTGSLTLSGAAVGYQSFDSVLDTGDTTWYAIAIGASWEVGLGTFTAPATLARTAILASSNGGSAVNLPAGDKDVFITAPADEIASISRRIRFDATQSLTVAQALQARQNVLIDIGFTDVASATTTDIGAVASQNVRVTGTTTITSFGTVAAGVSKTIRFAGALTLTHSSNLILPGAADIVTRADDTLEAVSLGSGAWFITRYDRAARPDSFVTIFDQVVSGAAVSAFDIALGAYSRFEIDVHCNVNPAAAADGSLAWRISTDGGSTYLSGASDYALSGALFNTTTNYPSGLLDSGRLSGQASKTTVIVPVISKAEFVQGSASLSRRPTMGARSSGFDGTNTFNAIYQSNRVANVAATHLRILATQTSFYDIGSRVIVRAA
jgi:hypothetical protein